MMGIGLMTLRQFQATRLKSFDLVLFQNFVYKDNFSCAEVYGLYLI